MSNVIFEEELRLNANVMTNVSAMIDEMNQETNLRIKKLSLLHFQNLTICAILNAISNTKISPSVLYIHEGDISESGAQSIINCIANSTLKKLILSSCAIVVPGSTTIIDAVATSSVRKLDLRYMFIDKHKAIAIAATLVSLTKLSFRNCTFEGNITESAHKESALELIIAAVKNSTLRSLKLASINSINNKEMMTLIDCVENSALIKLSLRSTLFRYYTEAPTKMAKFIAAIQKSTLQTLDVFDTPLFKEASNIIQIIKHSHITKFYFDQYNFYSETQNEIMNVIKCNSSFKNISFAGSTFTNRSLVRTCDLIKGSNLEELCLNDCYLSYQQLNAIIDAIQGSSIVSLNLGGLPFGRSTADAICNLLENHDLKKINVDSISHEMLRVMLPSILKSKLIKVAHNLNMVTDDDIAKKIKRFTKEQKDILKNARIIKSARKI